MAKSKITIVFDYVPAAGSYITFRNSLSPIDLKETFVDLRYANYQTELPKPNGENYDSNAVVNYRNALNLDYNSTGLYSFVIEVADYFSGVGTIVIYANQSNVVFSDIQNTTGATVTIQNETEAEGLEVTSTTYTQADTTPCNYVKLNLETNVLATLVNGQANSTNPVVLELLRELKAYVSLEDAQGNKIQHLISTPGKLLAAKITIDTLGTPTGTTITVLGAQINGLIPEFSMNNVDWQTSNKFSGIAPGTYTMYVKDQLGCSVQKSFTVVAYEEGGSGVGFNEPFAKLPSKANSIRFKRKVTWDDCNIYKTDENTLSCEVDVKMPYREMQRFQICDNETVQIKSNYKTIAAYLITPDAPESPIPVFKRSTYMNLKDARDAIQYDLGNGQAGIYFNSGNIYDFDTNQTTNTYTLSGALPRWAAIGNFVRVDGVWYTIKNILFDETKESEVIVIDNVSAGEESQIIIGSTYNLFNYEVYEFDVDFAQYLDKQVQVRIEETDPNFPTQEFVSELIDVKQRHDGTLEIIYFNEDNTDVNFGTGIKFKLRMPYIEIKGVSDDESEIHKTDVSAVLLKSEAFEVDEIKFQPCSKEMWRKLQIALSHSFVSINGQGYIKSGTFTSEGPLDDTNLYVLTATMIKTDNVYNTYNGSVVYIDGTEQDIPALVSLDDTDGYAEL